MAIEMLLSNIYIPEMWSRRSMLVRFFLISMLIWGQTAIAMHQVDHYWHESTDVCESFSVADNVNSVVIDLVSVDDIHLEQEVRGSQSIEFVQFAAQAAIARGPPSQ